MIINKSKNAILSKDFTLASGYEKTKGMMLAKNPRTIVFKTRFGIHTFFMKFPIDLIILNNKNKVAFIKESIKPNRIVFWNPKFNTVIEMPRESIRKTNTKIGDLIEVTL